MPRVEASGIATYADFPAFDADALVRAKARARIPDFVGERPLYVSLVLPTRGETDRRELRCAIIRHALRALNPIVSAGLVNEILVIDGTHDDDGAVDLGWLGTIAELALEEIDLFRNEVEVLRAFPGAADKARAGYHDFAVKFLHQRDGPMTSVLARMAALPDRDEAGSLAVSEVPHGKGAGLWIASAATRGDIVAFTDSDIRNFSTHFVTGLLGPILATWDASADQIRYVKAYYKRLGVVDVEGEPHAHLGGRVTRLLAKPAYAALAEFGLFSGLDDLDYPLSGEYAATRDVVESIDFPTGYGVEVSTLCQVMQGWGPHAIAQVNLELFQHLSQKEASTDAMAEDIASTLLYFARKYYGRGRVAREDLVDVYRDRALALVEHYAGIVAREREKGAAVVFDREKELARVSTYADAIRRADGTVPLLPNWRSLEEMQKVRRELRKRAVASTADVLTRIGALPLIDHGPEPETLSRTI